MLNPSHSYDLALAEVIKDPNGFLESECPLRVMLALEVLGKPVVANALFRAYEIFKGKRNSKIIMESLLFCPEPVSTLIEKIAKHMGTVKEVPAYYAEYFFDPTVFEDMFDKLDYIEFLAIESDNIKSEYMLKEKISKQLGLVEGFSYIISHFKGAILEYTASEYTKKLLAIANKYVAQAQNSGILSKESDKLYRWMQLASKLAITYQGLQESSVDDALQDIRIALDFDDRPDSIEVLPPEDVLRG